MAKIKAVEKSDDDSKKASEKATKTIKKPRVAVKKPPVSEMVLAAINENNQDGITLQNIRHYISKNYSIKMSKKMQSSLKDFIIEEFEQKRIRMIDHDDDKIHFHKRLQIVQK